MVLGAILATVLSCGVGTIWYSPSVLGNSWMRATFPGKSFKQIQESGSKNAAYSVTLLSCVTLALLMQCVLVNFFKVQTLTEAASVGFGLGCLLILADMSHCVFAERSFVAFLIDRVYDVAILTLMAVTIVYCNKNGLSLPLGDFGKRIGL